MLFRCDSDDSQLVATMPPKRARSSETPVPTTEGGVPDGSALPDAQWKAMQDILNHIYDYRLPEYVQHPAFESSRPSPHLAIAVLIAIVSMIRLKCFTAKSTSASSLPTTR